MALNLEKQLVFYGLYHQEPINVGIHMVCTPIILLSVFLILTQTGPLYPLPPWLTMPQLPPNLCTLAAAMYGVLYVLMEPVAGSLAACLLLGSAAGMNATAAALSSSSWWSSSSTPLLVVPQVAAVFLATFSVLQLVSHGSFEGRMPARYRGLVRAYFVAPLFVWLELLFRWGYRPELRARVSAEIARLERQPVPASAPPQQQQPSAVLSSRSKSKSETVTAVSEAVDGEDATAQTKSTRKSARKSTTTTKK